MPIGRSAKKSLRKSIKNKKVNNAFKIKLKESIKEFLGSPDKKTLPEVNSMLDKAQKNNIFKKNKVARLKARYAKKVNKKAEPKTVKTTKKM
ncbi:30S ribosomal protein S20 [Candidatus Shapirobacteria bacterium]|jgi:small subunit ribosomal protein S20|nr:30S ribosomal protein S20 [Candidatus Shapirobacteria bacterium]